MTNAWTTLSLRHHDEACLFPSELHAQDEIDKAIARIVPDERARLRFRAYPHSSLPGYVVQVLVPSEARNLGFL
jgi:hypothetical protein